MESDGGQTLILIMLISWVPTEDTNTPTHFPECRICLASGETRHPRQFDSAAVTRRRPPFEDMID